MTRVSRISPCSIVASLYSGAVNTGGRSPTTISSSRCASVVNLNLVPGWRPTRIPSKRSADAIFLGNDLIARLEEAAVTSDPTDAPPSAHRCRYWRRFQRGRSGGGNLRVMARTPAFILPLHTSDFAFVLLQLVALSSPELAGAPHRCQTFRAGPLRRSGSRSASTPKLRKSRRWGVASQGGRTDRQPPSPPRLAPP